MSKGGQQGTKAGRKEAKSHQSAAKGETGQDFE
jgi:hypothetical protein